MNPLRAKRPRSPTPSPPSPGDRGRQSSKKELPEKRLAHIPAKWAPVRRQEYAPNNLVAQRLVPSLNEMPSESAAFRERRSSHFSNAASQPCPKLSSRLSTIS